MSKKKDREPEKELSPEELAEELKEKKAVANTAKRRFYAHKEVLDNLMKDNDELIDQLREAADEYNKSLEHYKDMLRNYVKLRKETQQAGLHKEFKVAYKEKTILDATPLLAEMTEEELLAAHAIEKRLIPKQDEVEALQVLGKLTAEAVSKAIRKVPDTPAVTAPYKEVRI